MKRSDRSTEGQSRRRFLQWTGAAAGCLACASPTAEAASPSPRTTGKSLKLGAASYTFRNFDLDKTVAMTVRAGLGYICLKSMHLPLEATPEQIAAAIQKIRDAGLIPYGAGVVNMTKETEVTRAFEYGKTAGFKVLVAAPTAPMLPFISETIKKYDIKVAIHNHGPGDKHFPTPESAYKAVKDLDPRLGLCIDIGHTVRIGADLNAQVEMCADRLFDMHVKDITEASAKGHCIQLGRGVIDIPALLRLLVKIKYDGVLSYEYEAEDKDPLPGVCECAGYTKGVLAVI